MENVSAIWSTRDYAKTKKPILSNISFNFHNYEKVAIIGKVGCGKTTLLNTIMKETFLLNGLMYISGDKNRPSYCEQTPVILSGTIKSNILFGSEFKQELYEKVLDSCQLVYDINSFPNGDETETGEMGVQLSGGQKSRIVLARALYKENCKVMLIDGTLSSLDSRVA